MARPFPHRIVAAMAAAFLLVAACGGSANQTPGWTYTPGGTAAAGTAAADATPGPTVILTAAPTTAPSPAATALTFTPGTKAAPRIVALSADDLLNFTPGLVQAAVGETVTFRIHNTGTAVHEFMIGALADAFADKADAEVADIGPGQTADLTFTFDGTGPFGFACHAPGHFEHGMAGYIQLVGPGAPTVGTKADPRVVWLDMTDKLKFTPNSVDVAKGETIRFVLTNSGEAVHEFQVGPADKVAADEVDGVIVVEKDQLDAGSTRAVDYTFDGAGPYAYACHEPGHYENDMKGVIVLK